MSRRLPIAVLAFALDGGIALASPSFWPARTASDGALIRISPLAECRVHVTTDAGRETLHACGAPLSLTTRATAVWIEQGDAISGQIPPPAASEAVDLPLVAAGTVQLDEELPGEQRRPVRLLHVGGVRFSRTLTGAPAERWVRMPEGATLALEVDPQGDVSRFAVGRVTGGRTSPMSPAAPARGAALVGIFDVPSAAATAEEPATLVLDGDRQADLVVDHGDQIIALWRDLEAGATELTLRSDAYQLAPASVRLRARGVTTVRAELRPLPNLTVTLDVPERAQAAWQALEPSLALRRTADKKVVRELPAAGRNELRRLPLDAYELVLTARPWTLLRSADLTAGTDAEIDFALEPFTISGRVLAGNEPATASVTFRRGGGDATTVLTDSGGQYEVTLWTAGMYVVEAVLEESDAQPPFSRLYRLSSSRDLDIPVPRTKLLVRATDSATGKPVANAEVITLNAWSDAESGESSASHTTKTDADGIARLAPLSAGTAEIHVAASGYFKDEPTTIAVREDGRERTIAVKLRPARAGSSLRITLPAGNPAGGAEVLVVGDLAGRRTLWSGRTDAQGRVRVPRSLAGSILLVRHPAAAGLARRFDDLFEQEYRLAPASPQPLLVRAERHGDPAGTVQITVWFDDLPLSGSALEFLLRSTAFTSGTGVWVGVNLPRQPIRILASTGAIEAHIAAGAYDGLAAIVPEPRPNQLVVAVVD